MAQLKFPHEWHQVQLGDVVSYGKTQKCELSDVTDDTWVLELEDIEKESSRIINRKTATERPFKSTKNRFEKGNVLYGKLRPYLNKVVVADTDGVCTTEIIPLDSEPFVLNRYLFHWLKTRDFLNYVNEVSYGVNMPRLGTKDGVAAPFVLAPLAEQKVIADKLDTLLAQVENTKVRLERIPQILKRFRQSVLAAAVSGRLTEEWRAGPQASSIYDLIEQWTLEREELKSKKRLKKSFGPKSDPSPTIEGVPESWAWVNFDHIAEHSNNALKAGPFGSALKKSDCIDSGFKVYGQEQVIAGDEQLVTYYVNSEKYEQLNACSVKPGDILISLVGTIGKVLVLSQEAEAGIINPRLVKLGLQGEINKSFIQIYLESPVAHDFFRGFSHGGTMEILNLSILKELPIPLPPVEEQTEIVRRVDQLFTHADRIEQRVNNALARVNNLTQSILAKAFRGELTEQWRKDNPELISGENSAEALLGRIKAERAAKKPTKRQRKT